ncbi:hypothetical protein D3C72_1666440 [compost metagenome]
MQILEHARRRAGLAKRTLDVFRAQGRLVRMLEDDRVARHQCRHDAVHGRQQGIVPRRDRQGDADGLAADEARVARLRRRLDGGQGLAGDLDHVARAGLEARHLGRGVSQGPAHLDRDRVRDFILGRDKAVDGFRHDAPPHLRAQGVPGPLRGLRAGQRLGDLRFAGIGATYDFTPVDRADGDEFIGHGRARKCGLNGGQMISK